MVSLWCLVQASFRKEISWRGSRCWDAGMCSVCNRCYRHSLRPQLGMIWIGEKRGNGQREIFAEFLQNQTSQQRNKGQDKREDAGKGAHLIPLTEDVRDEQMWTDTGKASDRVASAWLLDLIWHTWLRAQMRLQRWEDPWRNAQASSVHKTSWMNLI